MSERYYITGAQIGMIKVMLQVNPALLVKNAVAIEKLIKEIEDKQFVGKITLSGERVEIVG